MDGPSPFFLWTISARDRQSVAECPFHALNRTPGDGPSITRFNGAEVSRGDGPSITRSVVGFGALNAAEPRSRLPLSDRVQNLSQLRLHDAHVPIATGLHERICSAGWSGAPPAHTSCARATVVELRDGVVAHGLELGDLALHLGWRIAVICRSSSWKLVRGLSGQGRLVVW